MNKDLHVALDTTAKKGEPEVVVFPKHLPLPKGTHSLRWTQIQNETFTFRSLKPLDNTSGFSNINVTPQLITATYTNNQSGAEYEYTIEVADAGGGSHSTIPKGGPIGNGGGPTIKNN